MKSYKEWKANKINEEGFDQTQLGRVTTPSSLGLGQSRMAQKVVQKNYTPKQIASSLARTYLDLIANDPNGVVKGQQALNMFWRNRKNFNQIDQEPDEPQAT